MGDSIVRVDDLQPGGPGGVVRFVRRELGVEAFGTPAVFRFDPETVRQPVAGPDGYEPHGSF